MRILDIDMDFFLNMIVTGVQKDGPRLNEEDFKAWDRNLFIKFLEEKCLLNKDCPTPGKIITHHEEAFHFWDNLIVNNNLKTPFHVTHIDAHTDIDSMGEKMVYILNHLMRYSIEERRKYLDITKVDYCDYLLFALACGWIKDIDFVVPMDWVTDFKRVYSKGFVNFGEDFTGNNTAFQLQRFNKIQSITDIGKIYDGTFNSISIDPEIPFNIIKNEDYQNKSVFDYVIFCQSPGYTPASADYMLDVIKDYIVEI